MTDTNRLAENLIMHYGQYMYLKIFVDSADENLKNRYIDSVNDHHLKMIRNIDHIDAGFDLFASETKLLSCLSVNKLDYKIICSAKMVTANNTYNTGYYMYPRSSISKSSLRLANNTGIIDSGYRGHLIGMFDLIYDDEFQVNKYDRYLQICAPNLYPIIVEVVDRIEDLGVETSRGAGGFGSTGV